MIKIKLTPNYTGIEITGDYDDFDELYDAITNVLGSPSKDVREDQMQLHTLGFCYDLRHAKQGDRGIFVEDNGLRDFKIEQFGIKGATKTNTYYIFYYIIPEILIDIIILNYFINKIEKGYPNDYLKHRRKHFNNDINIIRCFTTKVVASFKEILTPIRYNKIIDGINDCYLRPHLFCRQYFEDVVVTFLNCTKNQRVKKFMNFANKIYNFYDYLEYEEICKQVEKYAKENNCSIDDIGICDYPTSIDW